MSRAKIAFCVTLFLLGFNFKTPAQPDLPKTRAELTNYEETTRYEEVLNFITELQKRSPLLRLESFGKSEEGRMLPLMIFSDTPISNPRDARASGKPIVFIMANIHAGEVEGKEAALHLSRRILFGDLKPLLGKLIILIAPIYNADGNEKIKVDNRAAQRWEGGSQTSDVRVWGLIWSAPAESRLVGTSTALWIVRAVSDEFDPERRRRYDHPRADCRAGDPGSLPAHSRKWLCHPDVR